MSQAVQREFYCPKCSKLIEANRTRGVRNFTMEALCTSYFLCSPCRLMFISKQLIREEVASWYHRNNLEKVAPLKYFHAEAIEFLFGDLILGYYKKIGYKFVQFKKQPS